MYVLYHNIRPVAYFEEKNYFCDFHEYFIIINKDLQIHRPQIGLYESFLFTSKFYISCVVKQNQAVSWRQQWKVTRQLPEKVRFIAWYSKNKRSSSGHLSGRPSQRLVPARNCGFC